MKLHILGCGGWIPGTNETSCYLIEHKNQLLMLDAGTGVSNLKNFTNVLDKYDTLTIILSHYHLDHITGLIYLLPYIDGKTLNIYGPGVPFYEKSTRDYLSELIQPTFFSRPLEKFADLVRCFDYHGKDFDIDGIRIGIALQNHSSPSFRISVDDQIVYATDTCFNASEWMDCKKGEILLHECWDINHSKGGKHTSLQMLIDGFPSDLFNRILLIHCNPEWTASDYKDVAQRIDNTIFELVSDNVSIEI